MHGTQPREEVFEDNFPPSKKAQVLRQVLEQVCIILIIFIFTFEWLQQLFLLFIGTGISSKTAQMQIT